MKTNIWSVFILICGCSIVDAAENVSPAANIDAFQDACRQLPSRDLVLDLRQEGLEYGTRLDAGEFLISVLNVLLSANYNVRLSDDYIKSEINYYHANLNKEQPTETSTGILNCLERARSCGVLDWNCFKGDFNRSADPGLVNRHLPWLAPPFKIKAISLAGTNVTNFASLQLSLKWTGQNYGGAVQHTRRPGGLMGETVLTEGRNTLWAFSAVMRLTKADRTLFLKEYSREEWQHTYSTVYDRPLYKTSQAILQDLVIGLKPGPSVTEDPKKKGRKHS